MANLIVIIYSDMIIIFILYELYEILLRIPDIVNETYGLSHQTAMEHHPQEDCGMNCETHPETARTLDCIKCSWYKASIDLPHIDKYKSNITQVAEEKCFPASIIAAFISRETRGGIEHLEDFEGVPGWGVCQNVHYKVDVGRNERCYGIMHLPEGYYLMFYTLNFVKTFTLLRIRSQ